MSTRNYKPRTKSTRHMSVIRYRDFLTTGKPFKGLTRGRKKFAGRNSYGRITVRHQGAGHKQNVRSVDFLFDKKNISGRVEHIEYDPMRSGFIARIVYKDGERRYILAPKSLKVGSEVLTAEHAPLTPGNRLPLKNIPVGTFVYNIEIHANGGAKMGRSAGNYAELVAHDGGYAQLKLPSTEIRKVVDTAWASVGEVSNEAHHLVIIGKAGRSRRMGVRPTVRGTAMNPVDHPHGGGEGRQGRGHRRARSAWGKPTGKGQKSRTPKKYSNPFIIARRRVGKKKSAEASS